MSLHSLATYECSEISSIRYNSSMHMLHFCAVESAGPIYQHSGSKDTTQKIHLNIHVHTVGQTAGLLFQ